MHNLPFTAGKFIPNDRYLMASRLLLYCSLYTTEPNRKKTRKHDKKRIIYHKKQPKNTEHINKFTETREN